MSHPFAPAGEAPGPLADGVELARRAASLDVSLWGDDELMAAAVALEESMGALGAASAHVLARMDATEVTDRHFGHRSGRWLSLVSNTPKRRCQGRVRDAARLTGWFGVIDAAVSDG